MLRRFKSSPVSAILKRAMEQPPQPEIVLVPDEWGSESASPKVSSAVSDSETQLPDPEESNVVVTGNGVEGVYGTVAWAESTRPIHVDNRPIASQYPEWATPADRHMFGTDGREAMSWPLFQEYIHKANVQGL
jgi:hypothetical protein